MVVKVVDPLVDRAADITHIRVGSAHLLVGRDLRARVAHHMIVTDQDTSHRKSQGTVEIRSTRCLRGLHFHLVARPDMLLIRNILLEEGTGTPDLKCLGMIRLFRDSLTLVDSRSQYLYMNVLKFMNGQYS